MKRRLIDVFDVLLIVAAAAAWTVLVVALATY